MLDALYDQNLQHVGWIWHKVCILHQDLTWVAFVSKGQAYSVHTGSWLGPVVGTTCYDQQGRVVAWHSWNEVFGTVQPVRPQTQPQKPNCPRVVGQMTAPAKIFRPSNPPGGWSELGWLGWISQ